MADQLVASLPGEQILESNPLAVVTRSWIIVRPAYGRARVMIALHRLTDVRRIKTTHPALLVIASGLLLIAAAAYASKDGGGAAIPIAILAVLFFAGYFGTRRGSVVFVVGWEVTETAMGSLRDAAELVKTVRAAQKNLDVNGV